MSSRWVYNRAHSRYVLTLSIRELLFKLLLLLKVQFIKINSPPPHLYISSTCNMATITVAPWQQTMQSTRAYTQLCFAVEDFSYFSGRQALQEKAPVIYRTQFHQLVAGGAIPEGQFFPQTKILKAGFQDTSKQQEIKDLAQKAGEDVKAKTQEFANELQGDVQNKPAKGTSVSDWKEKLRKKNEEKKSQINKMMDDSMNNAMEKIQEMPEEQRGAAADVVSTTHSFYATSAHSSISCIY